MVLRHNAGLCECIGREVGGEVRAHHIQMWNVVRVPSAPSADEVEIQATGPILMLLLG